MSDECLTVDTKPEFLTAQQYTTVLRIARAGYQVSIYLDSYFDLDVPDYVGLRVTLHRGKTLVAQLKGDKFGEVLAMAARAVNVSIFDLGDMDTSKVWMLGEKP